MEQNQTKGRKITKWDRFKHLFSHTPAGGKYEYCSEIDAGVYGNSIVDGIYNRCALCGCYYKNNNTLPKTAHLRRIE